jgi:cytoskeletal protein CcmA (bactofilin family)
VSKWWAAAIGATILLSLATFAGSQTRSFTQCSDARASAYADDLNPSIFEGVTTFMVCEGTTAEANRTFSAAAAIFTFIALGWITFSTWVNASESENLIAQNKNLPVRPALRNQLPAEDARPLSKAPSVVSAAVSMCGALKSTGDFQIEGILDGDIECSSLVITETGQVHGEIQADRVLIKGRFKGSIKANQVVLCSGSHVEGRISHKSLQIEFGARFDGDCLFAKEPESDSMISKANQQHIPYMRPTATPENA